MNRDIFLNRCVFASVYSGSILVLLNAYCISLNIMAGLHEESLLYSDTNMEKLVIQSKSFAINISNLFYEVFKVVKIACNSLK